MFIFSCSHCSSMLSTKPVYISQSKAANRVLRHGMDASTLACMSTKAHPGHSFVGFSENQAVKDRC